MPHPFHLALHVRDLGEARAFYADALGAAEGRSGETWAEFDVFGHRLSLHRGEPFATVRAGQGDGPALPVPHFGVVLPLEAWNGVADRLEQAGADFVMAPQVRRKGEADEEWILVVRDPSGNPIVVRGAVAARVAQVP